MLETWGRTAGRWRCPRPCGGGREPQGDQRSRQTTLQVWRAVCAETCQHRFGEGRLETCREATRWPPTLPQKKPITSKSSVSTAESSSPMLPEQEEFRQHLRRLAVSAVQVLIEQVMCEELEQCIGASWGECTPKRRGYRNGSYTRDLVTPTGRIEDLNVPRDREGKFHSQVFERYKRYEPEVAEALTQMFVSGVSTHKVGEVTQTLLGVAPSASAVSRLNHTLTEQ